MKIYTLSLIGFSSKIIRRIDEVSKNQMFFGALTVWLVASFSSLLFATTISKLCFNGHYFWLIAFVWFIFIYMLDSLVLGADVRAKAVMRIRLGICIILASFHALILDTFTFHNDTRNFLSRKYNTEVARLDSAFQSEKIIPLLTQQNNLMKRNHELYNADKKSRDRIFEEIDQGANGRPPGRGSYAIYKERMYSQDSTQFVREQNLNKIAIDKIEDEVSILRSELSQQKASIVKPMEAGLRDNVNALHNLVWGPEGTFTDRFLFILLIFLGFIIESLTLIVKLAFWKSFLVYQEEVDVERIRVSSRGMKKNTMENELEDAELALEMQERTFRVHRNIQINEIKNAGEMSINKAKERLQRAEAEAGLILKSIIDTDRIDQDLKERLNGHYEGYGKSLVTDFRFGKIKNVADDLRGDRS